MKPNPTNRPVVSRSLLAMTITALALFAVAIPAQESRPDPDRAREREQNPQAKPEQTAAPRSVKDAPSPEQQQRDGGRDRRWIETRRELNRARDVLTDLRQAGKEAEAVEVERRVNMLEAQLARLERDPQPGREGEPSRGVNRPRGERMPRPEMENAERRLHHLEVAVENLHAGGMHELGEQLARQGERIRRESSPGGREGGPPMMRLGREMEQLRGEMEELRNVVRQLTERVEILSREKR